MSLKTKIVLILLAVNANCLNGENIIDTLSFAYGCPTMSGKCSCDVAFESGDYYVKVECNDINGDPNDFKDELKALRGYAIDILVISNSLIDHLPDSPFVESDGRTPITAISEVRFVSSVIYGFGSPQSLGNSFFDGLGYSMVTFTVDNCPYMRMEWQRFANSLMAAAEPVNEQTVKPSTLPEHETTINVTNSDSLTETTFQSTDSSTFESSPSSEFTDFSTNQFTDITTDLKNSFIDVLDNKSTRIPIPPIMEPL